MASIEGASLEIARLLATVPGIAAAPDYPLEQVTAWPVAYVYSSDGTSIVEPQSTQKDLHNLNVAVLMPLTDQGMAMRAMLPLYERVTNALHTYRDGRSPDHFITFQRISYTLGPVEWGDLLCFGYVFTMEGMKIHNDNF